VKEKLGIPPDRRIAGAVAIGHPADAHGPWGRSAGRDRPRIEDITHHQRWNQVDQERS
jgi:hypothetical protein